MPLVALFAICLASGCALRDSSLDIYLAHSGNAQATPGRFRTCVNFGCRDTEPVGLDPAQWDSVRALFEPPAADAAAEREQVRRAVARMEALVGPLAGTERDLPENQGGEPGEHQLDCIAESTNTTTDLVLFQRAGLLRFHRPDVPVKRGLGPFYPHNTAVLVETATGRAWAVDSWFRANAQPPDVVPLKAWEDGWHPAPEVSARP